MKHSDLATSDVVNSCLELHLLLSINTILPTPFSEMVPRSMNETERGTLKYAVNEYENLIQYELDYLVLKNP